MHGGDYKWFLFKLNLIAYSLTWFWEESSLQVTGHEAKCCAFNTVPWDLLWNFAPVKALDLCNYYGNLQSAFFKPGINYTIGKGKLTWIFHWARKKFFSPFLGSKEGVFPETRAKKQQSKINQ